jgi:ribosome biogenesis GTPase / thiamine phosphate phosphatase
MMGKENETMLGTVIRSTGSWYTVRLEDGTLVECRLRGRIRTHGLKATNPVTVGDCVTVDHASGEGSAAITAISERRNYIIRRSVNLSRVSHIIAANIDTAFVIASITSPRTSTGFIDRYLVTAQAYEIPAAIIFNKCDIYEPEHTAMMDELVQVYTRIGYPCLITSAFRGDGIEELRSMMQGKTSLFAGHSGVGKSALINRLEPGLNLKTGNISDIHLKGKHTTTFAQMHPLSFGGYIVDTPGIKEFGLIDFDKGELAMYFPEMLNLVTECQFYNCTHDHEPGCAVVAAVKRGEVSGERYRNYLNMLSGRDMQSSPWELK